MSNIESSPSVAQLIPTKPDAEVAADIKRRFLDAIVPAIEIIDECSRAGLVLQYQVGPGSIPFKHEVQNLKIVKFL